MLDHPFPVVAVLASMHHDGFVRGRAVAVLARSRTPLSDRVLAVRVTDHVPAIREAAAREVLRRATPEHAARIVPLLHRIEHRGRGADVLSLYLHSLIAAHGEAEVWAGLRASPDRDTRRRAYRRSLQIGLLGLDEATRLLPARTTRSSAGCSGTSSPITHRPGSSPPSCSAPGRPITAPSASHG